MHALKTLVSTAAATAAIALAHQAASAAPNDDIHFQEPFRVRAGEAFIDVEIGHAAPRMVDWDGDGVRDLLVGQFRGGQLRIYRNVGTNAELQFEDFAMFQTYKALGSVPSG